MLALLKTWLSGSRDKARDAEFAAAMAKYSAATAALRNQGWSCYLDSPPPIDATVQFIRTLDAETWQGRRADFNPLFNVAELWWRPIAPMIDVTPQQQNITTNSPAA